MISRVKCVLLLLTLTFFPSVFSQGIVDEFHSGFGGFSIKTGEGPSSWAQVQDSLDEYRLWGDSMRWVKTDFALDISVFMIIRSSSTLAEAERSIVLAKWRAATLKELRDGKATYDEVPFIFEGSKGVDVHTSSPIHSITRAFFVKRRIYVITLLTKNAEDLSFSRRIIDSFRLLNRAERTVAIIGEYAPPALVQERPILLPLPDSTNLGLQGAVRRVRDFEQHTEQKDLEIVQETHFDENGFTTGEIAFNEGYPDIITSWGWVNGERVNLQAAVNYPPDEGPVRGRQNMVLGSLFRPGDSGRPIATEGLTRDFGNRFITKLDDKKLPLERLRYSNYGTILLKEMYSYDGRIRMIKTTDASGRFINEIREKLDVHNNVVEAQILSDRGQVLADTDFEYKFDEKGNWIEKRAFRKGSSGKQSLKPLGLYFRNIQYYEDNRRQIG
jgi:hypothetical protein